MTDGDSLKNDALLLRSFSALQHRCMTTMSAPLKPRLRGGYEI